ncbi:MAG: hypothetical protein HC807_02670 [Gammaproteobacteria bacterium]|nr:hypothetical protein [Gammaproteobacteria bacterium]
MGRAGDGSRNTYRTGRVRGAHGDPLPFASPCAGHDGGGGGRHDRCPAAGHGHPRRAVARRRPRPVQIEYQIDPEHRGTFLRAIHAVEATRRRNGATSWRIYRDLGERGRVVERYVIASWAEYMRSRSRMTWQIGRCSNKHSTFSEKAYRCVFPAI